MLLLRHSYHPADAFVWAQCSTCLKFSSWTCEDQFHLYFAFLFWGGEVRLGSQSTYKCCRSITYSCTGQRLVRARVVLWSTPGLASLKHFAIFCSDTYSRCVFFGLVFFFFQAWFSPTRANPGFYEANKHYFYPSAGGLKAKNRKRNTKNDGSTSDTYVWYVCTYICTVRIY